MNRTIYLNHIVVIGMTGRPACADAPSNSKSFQRETSR
jgi:hypothetical protein